MGMTERKKKTMTYEQLLNKAAAFCAAAERCEVEVIRKLTLWGADDEQCARIMAFLYQEDFLNEERFCRAFVNDKYRFNKWGKDRIARELRLRKLPSDAIAPALEEIDEESYEEVLEELLRKKRPTIKAKTEYERNGKLIRFALSRGYAMRDILRYINTDDDYDDMD